MKSKLMIVALLLFSAHAFAEDVWPLDCHFIKSEQDVSAVMFENLNAANILQGFSVSQSISVRPLAASQIAFYNSPDMYSPNQNIQSGMIDSAKKIVSTKTASGATIAIDLSSLRIFSESLTKGYVASAKYISSTAITPFAVVCQPRE